MVTVVDATVPASQFALGETAERVPEAEFETVRVVAQDDGCAIPFLRASAPDLEELHCALEEDPSTEEVERLVEREESSLYRIRWQASIRLVVYILGIEDGMVLRARESDGRWKLRVLFPDHDSISSTYEFCKDHGIDLSIRRVKGIVESMEGHDNDLTEKQSEALAAGFESDYYRVPRGQKLESLADELDISHQALSERLRRGHRTLIEQTLL